MTVEGEDIVAVVGSLRGGELILEIGAFVREVQRLTERKASLRILIIAFVMKW
jgi:hypothetical protein